MIIALQQKFSVPDPNADQRAASNPVASVWVNASAGSGKTKVLTDRVTRLLLSGVRPEKILCLTYTRAGAAEMANRVTNVLSKWAVCEDSELDADLDRLQDKAPAAKQRIEARRLFARVLSCPGGLRIRTIHSFCQEILSRFPLEAGLPPHFALIDEQEIEILSEEILDDLLREGEAQPEGKFARAIKNLIAAQSENRFKDMLREIMKARAHFSLGIDGPDELVEKTRRLLQLEQNDTVENIRAGAMRAIPEQDLKQIALWLEQGPETLQERGRKLSAILALPRAQRAGQFDIYCSLFLTKENQLRKNFANKEIRQKHPEIDDICLIEAARLISILERIEAAQIAELTASVVTFGGVFAERLAVRKASRAAVDYDDLILFTENLLRKRGMAPWILYKLDRGLDHILVDEAQDTSRAQWNIVEALTQEFYAGEGAEGNKTRTLFVVGDEKQSIFSFQNADPESFLSLREKFLQRLESAGKKLDIIPLRTSFRSAPAILNAVDTIFANDATREGVSQDVIRHNAGGADKFGRVEIWPLIERDEDKNEENGEWIIPTAYEEERDPQAELAGQIADKIKHWLKRGEILAGFDKPVAPGDIMILLRRRGRFADLMVKALKAHRVPVTGVDRMHLIDQLPVMDLLAMLRFVLLPEDDLNLAALLRSPLIGISEEQLMQVAIGREGSLWESIKTSPAFSSIHDYLATKLNEADFSTPFAFLARLLNAPCPGNAISGRKALWTRLGDECLDPIEELLNAAENFTRSHPPSLQNFLRWLTQADAEIKRELDHGDQKTGGQVRIMTVHAAKGLEAPIVFLPDTTSLPRANDLPKLQWDEDGSPLFFARTPNFGAARRVWQLARDKQLEEYRRLFYVALTRASHRLYICGWQNARNEGDADASWYALAASALRASHQDALAHDDFGPKPDIVFADTPPLPVAAVQAQTAEQPAVVMPLWINQPVQKPQITHAFPPSQTGSAASPNEAFTRGRIIHRLLQSLPDTALEKRSGAVKNFLAMPQHNLTQTERDEIAHEVTRLLDDETFDVLFAPDALAEAPLTGLIDGVPVFRQIDRLCLRDDEVWIVDYKTNRPPPSRAEDIPDAYRTQLAEYRVLLSGIYPGKKIRCFLLWTYAPELMEIGF